MPNGLKTALLLGLLSGVLLALGDWFGGSNGLMFAFVIAAVMNFGSYWFSDRIVLRMYNAQEVGPDHRLYQIVERLSRQAGLPMQFRRGVVNGLGMRGERRFPCGL